LSDNVDKVSGHPDIIQMIPKVGSVNSVIRSFKFNKGRVKVGTTLWLNLFGSVD